MKERIIIPNTISHEWIGELYFTMEKKTRENVTVCTCYGLGARPNEAARLLAFLSGNWQDQNSTAWWLYWSCRFGQNEAPPSSSNLRRYVRFPTMKWSAVAVLSRIFFIFWPSPSTCRPIWISFYDNIVFFIYVYILKTYTVVSIYRSQKLWNRLQFDSTIDTKHVY